MPKITVFHCSDLHSDPINLPSFNIDLVVNTGDWLPNMYRTDWEMDRAYQKHWLYTNAEKIRDSLKGKQMIFCSGNHDRIHVDIEGILKKFGVNIIDITNRAYIHPETNLSMYGFPYIPWCGGDWSYECHSDEMARQFRIMRLKLEDAGIKKLDVLLAHAPPAGIFDLTSKREHIGNTILANAMSYEGFEPRYICSGHVHESGGGMMVNKTYVSQAARKTRILTIEYENEIRS